MTNAIIVHSVRETRDLGRARLRFAGWAPGVVAGAEGWLVRLASGVPQTLAGVGAQLSALLPCALVIFLSHGGLL